MSTTMRTGVTLVSYLKWQCSLALEVVVLLRDAGKGKH